MSDSLDTRLNQLETTSTSLFLEQKTLLSQLANQATATTSQRSTEQALQQMQQQQQQQQMQHLTEQQTALMIQNAVSEATAKLKMEMDAHEDTLTKLLELERAKSLSHSESLMQKIFMLERETNSRQVQSEADLRMLLEGVMAVKDTMLQLGKGQSEKRLSDDYRSELKLVKEELSESLREVQNDFKRRIMSLSRMSAAH
ncbi:hypothetical protein HDU81_010859 [Chytriomyces hyalinus]|nr:hypothetical protein HDU81_010859 [Chytriomyces hyalinus]